ncbi:MAG: hypothetical protein PHX40_01670 [Bacilli bacterium]|nr:hypothetical protein [Bacilli bacterium]
MKKFLSKKLKRDTTVEQEIKESIIKSIVTTFIVCFFIFFDGGSLPTALIELTKSDRNVIEWFFIMLPFVIIMHLLVSFLVCYVEIKKNKR